MKTVYTDRSRIESYQRCPRLRFLSYHQDSIGITSAREPLPLAVGKAVHKGLECLLTMAMHDVDMSRAEDAAVADAITEFSSAKRALALDLSESAAQAQPSDLTAQLASTAMDLGLSPDDPSLVALAKVQTEQRSSYEDWLWQEQAALVEGLVRAYSRRRLRPLLEEYEVLEVEREGQWTLAEEPVLAEACGVPLEYTIEFMSRPDALLRNRADNSLYLLSFKTASTWDVRKARDAEHDMQGLSEGVEVERRLGAWWAGLRGDGPVDPVVGRSQAMVDYLSALPAPPRILGIRYEYLLKGGRWEDKDLSARFGVKVWSQRSHLIRRYVAHSVPSRGTSLFSHGDVCWSYEWIKDDGSSSKLAWQNWRAEPVWESEGGVRAWIDLLDQTEMQMSAEDSTVGMEPREMGWKSAAQALGLTATHPLDEVFPAPLTVYRSDDQLRDWVDQIEAQERRVAEGVAAVESATDASERRHLLNVHFPMTRRACCYPTLCACERVCFGGEDIQHDPVASGLFKIRTPNHEAERNAVREREKVNGD